MEKDMKKAIVNKQKTHEAQMDPPPVLQNKFWGLGVLQEAPTESISILFWPFFPKIKWGWVPEVPSLGSLSWG
jgi:hypothetical protein